MVSMQARTAFLLLLLASITAVIGGCGRSLWETEFERRAVLPPLDSATLVRVREIPWERMSRTIAELREQEAASDIHPDEWPRDKADAAMARLLRGLQVSEDPSSITVVGRSAFRTTQRVRPNDGGLEAFARRTGATMVVWSSTFLGKAETVRQESITGFRTGMLDVPRGRDGRRRADPFTETETLWVPVVIESDQFMFVAYFLRERGIGAPSNAP